MKWIKEGVNYWENPDCPRWYLEESLIGLIMDVEGVRIPRYHFSNDSRELLIDNVKYYEYLSDK